MYECGVACVCEQFMQMPYWTFACQLSQIQILDGVAAAIPRMPAAELMVDAPVPTATFHFLRNEHLAAAADNRVDS